MIRSPKFYGDALRVYFVSEGVRRECTRVIRVVGGKAYEIWEKIVGYIFTSSGSAIRTSSGSFIRTKDQK